MVKHIQAYFYSENDADAAATDLKALGAIEVESGRADEPIGYVPDANDDPVPLPHNLAASSWGGYYGVPTADLLGEMTLAGDAEYSGAGPVVTAVVEDRMYDRAVEAVKRRGGRLE